MANNVFAALRAAEDGWMVVIVEPPVILPQREEPDTGRVVACPTMYVNIDALLLLGLCDESEGGPMTRAYDGKRSAVEMYMNVKPCCCNISRGRLQRSTSTMFALAVMRVWRLVKSR